MLKLTTCCFKYPIKEGLFFGGGVKILILAIWLIWFLVTTNTYYWLHPHYFGRDAALDSYFEMKLLLAGCVDILATILLLLAIRKENEKLLSRHLVYGVVSVISLVNMLGDRFLQIWIWFQYSDLWQLTWLLVQVLAVIAVQAYFTLLVRSHLHNLREQRERPEQPQDVLHSKAAEAEAQYRAQVAVAASALPY